MLKMEKFIDYLFQIRESLRKVQCFHRAAVRAPPCVTRTLLHVAALRCEEGKVLRDVTGPDMREGQRASMAIPRGSSGLKRGTRTEYRYMSCSSSFRA